MENQTKNWYDKSYKFILIIPALLIIFSIFYMVSFYNQHGDFIRKDVSLTGGTSITIFDSQADIVKVSETLKIDFPDMQIRGLSDVGTGSQRGFIAETKAEADVIKKALEDYLGYSLDEKNSSIEFSGATLSQGFYRELINSILAAFLLMAWVVFLVFSHSRKYKGIATMLSFFGVGIALSSITGIKIFSEFVVVVGFFISIINKENKKKDYLSLFGLLVALEIILIYFNSELWLIPAGIALIALYVLTSIPSFAVILSAFADILMTLVVVNIFGISVSSAGIIAFLMLIGYSVDTDIMLTSRLLKKSEGSVNERTWGAFKTGMTMTLTSIAAVGVSLFIVHGFSETLSQIFTIVLIGLFFDIVNTWFTNASMLKWYMEVKHLQ